MADPGLSNVTPKLLRDLKIFITTYNESVVDITGTVNEISLYESIFTPFIYGEIIVIDSSAMLSIFPFIGQEKIRIEFEREGERVRKDFRVTNVFDVSQMNDTTGGYGLSITSEKQVINSISLFSKSYKGNSADIIKEVHEEYLKENLKLKVTGKFSHSVVFPWIKPLAAINMIQRATPAEDDTPMFVYESLYGDGPVLNSMKNMLESTPVFKINSQNVSNDDIQTALSLSNVDKYRSQIYGANITKAYDTLDKLNEGVFGSFVTAVDISQRTAEISDFNFRKSAPPISNDWVSTYFRFDNVGVDNIRTTKNFYVPKNTLAFEDYPNLNSVDDRTAAAMNSYMKRLTTTSVSVYMNSVTLLEVGKTIFLDYTRFSPKLSKTEDTEDKVNSGTYLISAIRHYIKNGKYTMSIELVRDGIGEDARLYPNGRIPDFGLDYRDQVSILPEIDKPQGREERPLAPTQNLFTRFFSR